MTLFLKEQRPIDFGSTFVTTYLAMKKTKPYDWTPSLILVGCTVLFPGPGFLIGGIASIIYVLLKALLFPPADDTEKGMDCKTNKQAANNVPLLPKPRPRITRNDS